MSYLVLLELAVKYAPEAERFIANLTQNVAAGRSRQIPTEADWAELDRLGALTAEAIFVRRGVVPPPPV